MFTERSATEAIPIRCPWGIYWCYSCPLGANSKLQYDFVTKVRVTQIRNFFLLKFLGDVPPTLPEQNAAKMSSELPRDSEIQVRKWTHTGKMLAWRVFASRDLKCRYLMNTTHHS